MYSTSYLAFLYARGGPETKKTPVEPFFVRAVNDLEMCKTFLWGRLSFDQNMRDIIRAMDHFGGIVSKGGFTFPNLCTSLELLPFEAIP